MTPEVLEAMGGQRKHGRRWFGRVVTWLVVVVVGLQLVGLIAAMRQAADPEMNQSAEDGRVAGLRELTVAVPAGETLVVFDESRHRPLVQARQLRMRLAWFRHPDAVVGSRDADWDAITWLYYDGPLEGEFRLRGIGDKFERHAEVDRHVIYRARASGGAEVGGAVSGAAAAGKDERSPEAGSMPRLGSPGWVGWAGGALAFAAVWLVGWVAVGRWLPDLGTAARLWLGLPVGQTMFMLALHGLLLGGVGLSLWLQLAVLLALGLLAARIPGGPGRPGGNGQWCAGADASPTRRAAGIGTGLIQAGGAVLLLVVAAWHAWWSQQQPLDCLPGLGNWAFKAAVLAHGETGLPADFPGAARWNAHQADYPLGFPLLLQWPLQWGFNDGAAALKLLNVVWVVATAGWVHQWLRRSGAGHLSAWSVAALVLTHESVRLFATDLYAEPLLWCHALTACTLACGRDRERALALLLAGGCALVKHEGAVVAAIVLLWCMVTAGSWRRAVVAGIGTALLAMPGVMAWWWRLAVAGSGTEDFSSVEDGVMQVERWRATWAALAASWSRAFGWADLARVWPWLLTGMWAAIALRARLAVAGNVRGRTAAVSGLPLVATAAAMLGAQVAVFYFSSHPVEWHTRVVGRTALLPFWLLAVAAVAAVETSRADGRSGGREAGGGH